MKKDIITTLKELQSIQPDAKYAKHSRSLILMSPQNNQFENNLNAKRYTLNAFLYWFDLRHTLMTASAVAVFALIVITAVSYLPGNRNELVAEANEVSSSIQIRLDEIKYQLDNQPLSSSTIIEMQKVLDETVAKLSEAEKISSDAEKTEEMLKQIKSAQETLSQINSLFQK